nr:helicase [Bacillus paranthracis]
MNRGNNSTAFAMMLLQRRLSSSIEAVHLSLVRRHQRLVTLLEEMEKKHVDLEEISVEDYEEATFEEQELLEKSSEESIDTIDPRELEVEITELERLIHYSSGIRQNCVERKYIELENTLFGTDGLLQKGEK